MPEIPRWARQKWGDYQGKWHLSYADGRLLCPSPVQDGALYLPRVEWRAHFGGMPVKGKVCRRCEAIWQAEHAVLSCGPTFS